MMKKRGEKEKVGGGGGSGENGHLCTLNQKEKVIKVIKKRPLESTAVGTRMNKQKII